MPIDPHTPISEVLGRPLRSGERCFRDGTLMTEEQKRDLARDESRPDYARFWCASAFFAPMPKVEDVAEWLGWPIKRAFTAACACEERGLLRKGTPDDLKPSTKPERSG